MRGYIKKLLLASGMFMSVCSNAALVDISEQSLWGDSWYEVTNNSSQSIQFFAVSNTHAATFMSSPLAGWSYQTVEKSDWDLTKIATCTEATNDCTTFKLGQFFGAFENLFGLKDSYANVYYSIDSVNLIDSGTTVGHFYFNTAAASEYVALDHFGSKIYQSYSSPVSQVPEPSAIFLLGLGLAGVFLRRRSL